MIIGDFVAFDDILEPHKRKPLSNEKGRDVPKSKATASILDNFDVNEWSKRLGLNDELTQQVIVPLLGILDKHGGKVVSPQGKGAQTIGAVSNLMEDFGPLLAGAYRYFAGVRHELNKADEELLNAHSAALSATELSSLFGSEEELVIENDAEAEQQTQQNQQQSSTFGPDGFNPPKASQQIIQQGKVDYFALMGYGSEDTYYEGQGEKAPTTTLYSNQSENRDNQIAGKNPNAPEKQVGLVPVDFLALEGGLTSFEVNQSDTNNRIEQGASVQTVDVSTAEGVSMVNDGLDEIQKAMADERMMRKTTSKSPAEKPSMTNEEIVAHMKQSAKPGKGGQQIGDKDVGKAKSSVSDAELASFVNTAFNIPGLADLQAQEAAQTKADSKISQTADALRAEAEAESKGNKYNQTALPEGALEELQPISAVEQAPVDSTEPQPLSIEDLMASNIGIVSNMKAKTDDA
jgi:hypothetical protein